MIEALIHAACEVLFGIICVAITALLLKKTQ